MKKAFVLGVLAIFAISICNVNAQNRTATPQKKGTKVEETKKSEPKVDPNTSDTPQNVKTDKTATTATQPKTSDDNNKKVDNNKTTAKEKVSTEKTSTPATPSKPKMTKDNKTTAPEKATATTEKTAGERTSTPQKKTGVNSLKKPIGKEKVATQKVTKKDSPAAEKDNTSKNTKNVNNSVPPRPKNDKQQGTAKKDNNDIK